MDKIPPIFEKIPKLKELLESDSFRTKTAMYIGEKKIYALDSFFTGIEYAFEAYNINASRVLYGFSDWVSNYYNWPASTAGWKNIILKECKGNDEKAINEFFRLYDIFKVDQLN